MRSVIILITTFILTVGAGRAQPGWQERSGAGTSAMGGIAFIDSANGFIVGYDPFLLKTTDGGASWNRQEINVIYKLNNLYFFNREIGMLLGDETIFRTTDGGTSWNKQRPGIGVSGVSFNATFFQSADTGIVIGGGPASISNPNNGIILRTTDGGVTWKRMDRGKFVYIEKLTFRTNLDGFALGALGAMIRTTDGGLTWAIQSTPAVAELTDIAFAPGNRLLGIAVGMEEILRTTDGGSSWTRQPHPRYERWLDAITFRNDDFAIAMGFGPSTSITEDGGLTWNYEADPDELSAYRAIAFNTPNSVTAVGDYGLIRQKIFQSGGVRKNDEMISSNAITGDAVLRGSSTTVHFNLSGQSHARLSVFDGFGRRTELLVDEELSAGAHDIVWDYSGIPNGIYFYQLLTGEKNENPQSRKVIVER